MTLPIDSGKGKDEYVGWLTVISVMLIGPLKGREGCSTSIVETQMGKTLHTYYCI